MNDFSIFILIYLFVFFDLLFFALKYKPVSDRLLEYKVYLDTLETGNLLNNEHGLIAACPTVILIPYFLNKYLHINKLIIFEIVPCFFYALMPAFCFLISRNFLSVGDSIIASLFVFSHFYFIYYPNMGRVSIALGFLSGAVWALLSGNIWLMAIFSVLVVISHYGTAHYTLFVLGGAWAYFFMRRDMNLDYINLSSILVIFTLCLWWWTHFMAKSAGSICDNFIKNSLTFNSRTLMSPDSTKFNRFMSMDSREGVVQAAFGKGFKYFTFPQRVELLTSWALVILVSAGFLLSIFNGITSELYRLLALISYIGILLTLIIPHISAYYGIVRVYFTSLVILAPCFVFGADTVARMFGIKGYLLSIPLIVLYFLCVSGLLHSILHIDKRLKIKNSVKDIWRPA